MFLWNKQEEFKFYVNFLKSVSWIGGSIETIFISKSTRDNVDDYYFKDIELW